MIQIKWTSRYSDTMEADRLGRWAQLDQLVKHFYDNLVVERD
jgi:hypothetical protein